MPGFAPFYQKLVDGKDGDGEKETKVESLTETSRVSVLRYYFCLLNEILSWQLGRAPALKPG